MPEEDSRTAEELEEDLAVELHERIQAALTGKTYTLEEVFERRKQRRTELGALKPES